MEKRNEQEHNLESGETTYGPNREKRGKRAVFNVQPATRPGDVPVLNVQQCVSPTLVLQKHVVSKYSSLAFQVSLLILI